MIRREDAMDRKFRNIMLDIVNNQGDKVTDDYLARHISTHVRYTKQDIKKMIPDWEQRNWLKRDGRKGLKIRNDNIQ
jgi:hypothetical protein